LTCHPLSGQSKDSGKPQAAAVLFRTAAIRQDGSAQPGIRSPGKIPDGFFAGLQIGRRSPAQKPLSGSSFPQLLVETTKKPNATLF